MSSFYSISGIFYLIFLCLAFGFVFERGKIAGKYKERKEALERKTKVFDQSRKKLRKHLDNYLNPVTEDDALPVHEFLNRIILFVLFAARNKSDKTVSGELTTEQCNQYDSDILFAVSVLYMASRHNMPIDNGQHNAEKPYTLQ